MKSESTEPEVVNQGLISHTWKDTVPTKVEGKAYKAQLCIRCGCVKLRHLQTFKSWFKSKAGEFWTQVAPECTPDPKEMSKARDHWKRMGVDVPFVRED
jgi:hypothetical protein